MDVFQLVGSVQGSYVEEFLTAHHILLLFKTGKSLEVPEGVVSGFRVV